MSEEWKENLVKNNLDLVYKIAGQIQKHTKQPVEYEELVSMGTIGLYDAAEKYDPKRGIRFSSFAYYRVRGTILDNLRKSGWKSYRKVGLHAKEASSTYLSVKSEDKNTKLSAGDTFAKLAGNIAGLVIIHQISMQEEENPLQIADEKSARGFESVENTDMINHIRHNLKSFPEIEQELIEAFYFKGESLKDFAERHGKTKSWSSRLHAAIIDKLKKTIKI